MKNNKITKHINPTEKQGKKQTNKQTNKNKNKNKTPQNAPIRIHTTKTLPIDFLYKIRAHLTPFSRL